MPAAAVSQSLTRTGVLDGILGDPRTVAAYRCAGWGFGSKRIVALQAADWLAYEAALYGKRVWLPELGLHEEKRKYPIRKSFEHLCEVADKTVHFCNTRDQILGIARYNYELPDDDVVNTLISRGSR